MPRLESITVSHSILSLTCDRNKAVLKATFSPACAVLRLLTVPAAAAAAASLPGSVHHESMRIAPAGSARLRGTYPAQRASLLPNAPSLAIPAFPRYFYSHFLFQQECGFVLFILHCQ